MASEGTRKPHGDIRILNKDTNEAVASAGQKDIRFQAGEAAHNPAIQHERSRVTEETTVKETNIMQRIYEPRRLLKAWQRVKTMGQRA